MMYFVHPSVIQEAFVGGLSQPENFSGMKQGKKKINFVLSSGMRVLF
jgi:hypothetical protein